MRDVPSQQALEAAVAYEKLFVPALFQQWGRVIADMAGIAAGQRVLDVGCGVGGPAIRLARATNCTVVGINVSQSQIQQAAQLAPGAVSGVVRTPYGFEIIKVTGRRGGGELPLAQVQERIRGVLTAARKQEREAAFVAQLRQKSKVELLDPVAP